MRIGLIDVDSHNFPNLPLMKLSAWHKQQGDTVEWYDLMTASAVYMDKHEFYYDKVYMSKIFSFTPDYEHFVLAKKVQQGGSGYCIFLENGKEVYHKENDTQLSYEVEHIYPDYSLYPELTKDTAYGFMSRGCPRGCKFCHVEAKEGKYAYKAADLSEFWRGQKNIVLLDPNTIACKDWKDILGQLIESRAWVDFSQGVDIRLMTEEKAETIKQIKTKNIHFAWDRYEDKDKILPKFKMFRDLTGYDYRKLTVYMLCNFNTTFKQDLERVYTLRDLGYSPYVMLYDKEHIPKGHRLKHLQRWVNNRIVFRSCDKFEDFDCRK
ncbi:MAG: radical SAM protein [Roseburia sp.]|nr:radical SAM protein [Roseburia sp.]